MFEPINEADYDMRELTRQLDIVKSKVFMGRDSAFLSSLMCSMEFQWTKSIPTAATNGVDLIWNPDWFLSLKPRTRETVFVHELWHPAKLHMIRQGSRDPKLWNVACDHWINNELEDEGYSFEGVEWCCKDQQYRGMVEEDIYDKLPKDAGSKSTWGLPEEGDSGDMLPSDATTQAKAINNLVTAIQSAKLAGQPGSIPGGLEEMINEFLTPVVPWEQELHKWFTELSENDFSWLVRDRRSFDVYLPSEMLDEGGLEHLMYFQDVSGSISTDDSIRFNSELKFVKEQFNPKKMTIVQFDTRIQDVKVMTDDDPFEEIKIVGRGGTCLRCVRAMIEKEKPTAAIIFSDMHVSPMQPLTEKIPIIWIDNGGGHTPSFGKVIKI